MESFNIVMRKDCLRMKRIGMLTSGGDCQALNAAMRGVVKGLSENVDELEIYGFHNGYKGLIYGDYRLLTSADFSGILTKGGTILGSSRQPFKQMRVPDENGLDKVEAMKQTYHKLNLDCLVILGGNGTQKTANLLREEGLNVVHLPKTIDNDIYGTDVTFGFQSAINIATEAIDCIHTTAASHNRVFIVEVMGHKVGWLTLYAGIAGGADIILLPEIPYDINKVIGAINKRKHTRQKWPTANIRPFPMRLRIRFMKQQVLRSVLRFRDIHSGAEAHVHMTECSVPDLALQQHRQSLRKITAA